MFFNPLCQYLSLNDVIRPFAFHVIFNMIRFKSALCVLFSIWSWFLFSIFCIFSGYLIFCRILFLFTYRVHVYWFLYVLSGCSKSYIAAAAAAKSLQSCPTLCYPIDGSPPGSPVPGVGCHFLLQCMKGKVKVKSISGVRLCATPWTAAYQAPPSMGFSRQ